VAGGNWLPLRPRSGQYQSRATSSQMITNSKSRRSVSAISRCHPLLFFLLLSQNSCCH
jgi:hypothetical protein